MLEKRSTADLEIAILPKLARLETGEPIYRLSGKKRSGGKVRI